MKSFTTAALTAALVLTAADAGAQEYPTRPVKMIVPYAAGGGTDVLSRLVGQSLTERLGQPIIIENRPGAAGSIGTVAVIKSPPDGYTLMFNNETLAVAPSITKTMAYDATQELTPLGLVAKSVIVIGVASSVPAKSLGELIAMAKADPQKLSYSTCGTGTIMHFAGEQLKIAASIEMTHVPYRGCGPAIQSAATGEVPVFINALTVAANLEKQGRVRILAVASNKRSTLAPEIPTVAEQGFPDFDATPFQALYGPPGMPAAIAKRLATEVNEAVQSTELNQKIRNIFFEPAASSPEDLAIMVRNDIARWKQVAKEAKIEAE